MAYETNITSLGLDLIDNPAEPLSKSQTKLSANIQLINNELESKASKLELNLLSSALSQSLEDMSDSLDTSMETLDSKLAQAEEDVAAAVKAIELLVPPQTNNAGKVLSTNGTTTEWIQVKYSSNLGLEIEELRIIINNNLCPLCKKPIR